jgi:EAL domain-containing protein (putative c-di-GMP-specific phosphodiesterase class I)
LAVTGLAPHRLQLEISEKTITAHPEAARETLQQLSKLQVKLAIDDYGTGSLSFASLNQFPIDMLKVDGRMLAGIDASKDVAALVHSLAVLVRNLGIRLAAEGVESEQQTLALQELGCEQAQGHFFAGPAPAGEVESCYFQCGGNDLAAAGAMTFAHRWADYLTLETSELPSIGS